MTQLTGKLLDVPLNQIAIPGSHDSFTYPVTGKNQISPDAPKAIRILAKIFGRIATNIIARWAKTQQMTTSQQLENGIRYFDVRIVIRPNGVPALAHSLYLNDLQTELSAMAPFLTKNPHEVILLDFNHFYNVTDEEHRKIIEMLQQVSERMNHWESEKIFLYKFCWVYTKRIIIWKSTKELRNN